MFIKLLIIIRKILRSIGKREENIKDLIILKLFQKDYQFQNLNNKDFNPYLKIINNVKVAATITFFYDKEKIINLTKVCKGLYEISNQNEIYIFTNKVFSENELELSEALRKSLKINIIQEPINNRLLPWYHINFMRKLFISRTDITHFAHLEDDILLNKNNFNYWLNSREVLKKLNLIPGFVRTEINDKDKNIYAIDFLKKNFIKNLPKIKINDNYYFVNHKYPYQAMYLYDRDLMNEHLNSPSSNPDCGHGAYDINYLDSRMINLDLMAKANIGLTFINVPKGLHNRMVVLYSIKNNRIDKVCEIQHLSNKYANTKSSFGNIKIEEAIK